jgi:hypothetical protein
MKHVTSSRRQIVMATLLGLAVLGAGMRYWAADPSLARDIGTLLLVLWLPAVGNLVAFLVRQWHVRRPRRPMGFEATQAFAPQLIVRISPLEAQAAWGASIPPDQDCCTVIIGNEGFTARTAGALSQVLAGADMPRDVELELLRPELVLPRLVPGTGFRLLVGRAPVAQGTVVRAASPA